jgi:agmatinase
MQEPAFRYVRHAHTPFFRVPYAPFDDDGVPDFTGADAVLLGVPYDGGTTGKRGAAMAPWEVRRVSAFVQGFHATHRIDPFVAMHVVDGGNIPTPPFDAATTRAIIDGEIGRVAEAGAVPLVIGGDHSIALPTARALARVYGPLAVVHIDAHFDTSTGDLWGDDHHHGTPLRHMIDEGLIAPKKLFQVGMRGPLGGPEDRAKSGDFGGRLFTADAVDERGVRGIAAEIRSQAGDAPVYLTFDVDAVDPAFAPGTGTPVPGGLSSRESLALVRALAGVRLVGMDIVEVSPAHDHAELTVTLAAHLLFEGLALAALHRSER